MSRSIATSFRPCAGRSIARRTGRRLATPGEISAVVATTSWPSPRPPRSARRLAPGSRATRPGRNCSRFTHRTSPSAACASSTARRAQGRTHGVAPPRIPVLLAHVPRPDPGARGPVPRRRPRLPGFGRSSCRAAGDSPTLSQLARVTDGFVDALGLDRHTLYVRTTAPRSGYRLALEHPSGSRP